MITGLFFKLMGIIIGGLLGLFPAFTLPPSMTDLGSTVGAAVATANTIFPVRTLGICLGIGVAVRLFLFGFQAVVFVYRLLPFKAS